MNQRHLDAFIERIKQGLREMPRMSLVPMTAIGRWFGREADEATRRPDAPSSQTPPAPGQRRPSGPAPEPSPRGPLWRGPATPVPEHVRQHGMAFQSIGIDTSPAPRDDMRAALASALDRIAALEQRQDELTQPSRAPHANSSDLAQENDRVQTPMDDDATPA